MKPQLGKVKCINIEAYSKSYHANAAMLKKYSDSDGNLTITFIDNNNEGSDGFCCEQKNKYTPCHIQ